MVVLKILKKLFSKKKVIFWAAFSVLFVALLITANILATDTFGSLINGVFGGERAIVDPDVKYRLYAPDSELKNKEDALNNGNAVTQKICEEGMVLLKNENNALPLNQGAKVSIFGKNSVKLVYGGSGSAAPTQSVPLKTIYDSLTDAGFECNEALKNFYSDNKKSGEGRSENPKMEHGKGIPLLETGETPVSSYTSDITSTYSQYKDAAIVVFSRIAGENWDLPRTAADQKLSRHYLELDDNERALLQHICAQSFEHVIVLFNGSNNIDMAFLKIPTDPAYNSKIDAAILIGSPGATGIMALGRILNGTVNPSGHLTDTIYTHYEQDPTWKNFGDNSTYQNYPDKNAMTEKAFDKALEALQYGDAYIVDGETVPYFSVAYEEGIYLGYRYYETRGLIEGEDWYNQHVLYPFGYGLSYTTFTQEITNKSALEAASFNFDGKAANNTPFTVDVKVKNTGNRAGKQVVQVYASAPYTNSGIEKAHKVLVGFAKTDLLVPEGQSGNNEQTLHIDITPYDFASFDGESKNAQNAADNYKGYILEAGNYTFYMSDNVHNNNANESDSFVLNLSNDVRFENDPVTGKKVEPVFYDSNKDEKTYLNQFLQENLSRSNFADTFPEFPSIDDRTVPAKFIRKEDSRTSDNPEEMNKKPKMGAKVTLHLEQMSGKDYDDPDWDKFLDQMKFGEMLDLFNKGMYATEKLTRLGVPKTLSCDGPTGIVAFMGDPAVYGTCYYCSECLVAQTYNVELAAEQGNAVGNEALFGDQRPDGSHLPYTGWYSPGVNLHRSPFSGRNTEYYSEDPFISGKMAAKVIEASQAKGVYTTIKHFALNEQETHRSTNGQNYWVKEQAIRELYLKPFEIAIKEGRSRGLMSSFTRVGQRWCGGCYPLLTTVLRQEWGFKGTVICDFHTDPYMDNAQMAFAGGDLNLTGTRYWKASAKEPENCVVLRRAAHNTLYALANSNAMNQKILGYKPPVWHIVMYSIEGGLGLLFLAWGALVIIMTLRSKDDGKGKKSKKAKKAAATADGEVMAVEEAPSEEAPKKAKKAKKAE